MSKDNDKRYCVIDHANKQRDRERRYPAGQATRLKRPGHADRGKAHPAGKAVDAATTGDC